MKYDEPWRYECCCAHLHLKRLSTTLDALYERGLAANFTLFILGGQVGEELSS